MREIDTIAYISTLRDIVKTGQKVSVIISGSSMAPFLVHQRDSILIGKPEKDLKKGDMVFYERETGQFVMHRIRKVRKEGLYLIGDAQTETEGPLNKNRVFAIVKEVYRKGKWIGSNDKWWIFFSTFWLWVIPLRPYLLKIYSLFSHK